jgi:hypothetical protein
MKHITPARIEQEPVAWRHTWNSAADLNTLTPEYYVPLYTAPPQRKWQGLTDEEEREIFDSCEREDRGYVAAMVEAKLKEKNNG